MQRFSYFIFFLPICLLLFSCEDKEMVRKLDDIETFAQERPDSARALLESIPPKDLSSPGLRARHALMLSTALNRCKVKVESDSLINIAVDYYKKQPWMKKERYLSYYYQGRIYQDRNDFESAMQSYIDAESNESPHIPLRYRSSLEFKKGSIYLRLYSTQKAIQAYQKAGEYALKDGWTSNYVSSILSCINVYEVEQDYEKIDSCFKLLAPYLSFLDHNKRMNYKGSYVQYLMFSHAPKDSIKKHVDAFVTEFSCKRDFPWQTSAYAYNICGEQEAASNALENYKQSKTDFENDPAYYVILSHIQDSLGHYHEGLEAYRKYVVLQEKINYNKFKKDTKFMEERHFHEIAGIKLKNRISLFSLCCILILSFLLYYLIKRKEEKEQLEIEYHSLLEEQAEIKRIVQEKQELSDSARLVLGKRVSSLAVFLSSRKPSSLKQVATELESLTKNRKELIDTIGMLYAIYYPNFVSSLMKYDLTPSEIGYCCLMILGFRTGEIGEVINRSGTYNISSTIRHKLGLKSNDTNLSIYLKNLFKETQE